MADAASAYQLSLNPDVPGENNVNRRMLGQMFVQGVKQFVAPDEIVPQRFFARPIPPDQRPFRQDGENHRGRSATEGLAKEKALIEDQLAQSKAERTKLQQEIAAMKREAEQTWAAERVENALLRERINDVAAEVARLTSALEGPDSPIDAILASDAARMPGTNGNHGNGERLFVPPAAQGEGKGSLADRIRALQTRASRIGQAS
jgi:chorismate mutase